MDETPILQGIFVTLFEKSSVMYLLTEKSLGCYFQAVSPYYHLFPYPKGDKSERRKPKKEASNIITATINIYLPKLV